MDNFSASTTQGWAIACATLVKSLKPLSVLLERWSSIPRNREKA
ncbi:hypothetical protein [Coleofasciculus sp. F4-SAH-05]